MQHIGEAMAKHTSTAQAESPHQQAHAAGAQPQGEPEAHHHGKAPGGASEPIEEAEVEIIDDDKDK